MQPNDERLLRADANQQARESVQATPVDLYTEDIVDMAARVDAMGDIGYLFEPVWPSDAYGVLAAKDKAGKTWVAADAAVSVASGTPWLGRFASRQGTVLLYAGEGGARNIVRRIRAIAEHKDIPFGTLRGSLRVSERSPRLADEAAMLLVREECMLYGPSLVIIDPLYLAARGARGSDLYSMGDTLVGVQEAAQVVGSALMLTHHWNKTGTGKGAERMTGVGPGAWGRVLGSGDVAHSVTLDGGRSKVEVEWQFIGSEIPETAFVVVREVWADDPSNLASPLHYSVQTLDGLAATYHAAVREQELVENIVAYIAANPGCPNGSKGAGGVLSLQGDDSKIRRILAQLQSDGTIRDEGAGGRTSARAWHLA